MFLIMCQESWGLLLQSAPFVLLGLIMAGLLKAFVPPAMVLAHLGQGRVWSVIKATLVGIPLPLCSCGVLPTAVSLGKQGANRGAVAAFLIATPETGVDSIAASLALLDPLLALARPVAALASAMAAGLTENFWYWQPPVQLSPQPRPIPMTLPPRPLSLHQRLLQGLRYALGEVWSDIAVWFLCGLLIAGVISALLPAGLLANTLGGGLAPMLLMLAAGIPLYICATASTPVAAALILKGLSPGAALVFLLVGPATNLASLTLLWNLWGGAATLRYLAVLSGMALLCGLALDACYQGLGLTAAALVGQSAEFIPSWLEHFSALLLLACSIKPLAMHLRRLSQRFNQEA
ncbi:MAG: hypothetical protein BWK76_03460 [Desulfobulbaceae bacterium A2]|nr:MAG: hypothetical protein BWK76_03460 [Desulfobulbaceae bacterium A2]